MLWLPLVLAPSLHPAVYVRWSRALRRQSGLSVSSPRRSLSCRRLRCVGFRLGGVNSFPFNLTTFKEFETLVYLVPLLVLVLIHGFHNFLVKAVSHAAILVRNRCDFQ